MRTKFLSALICAVMFAGFTACENNELEGNTPNTEGDSVNNGTEQTDPNGDSESDERLNGHEAVDLGLPSGLLWATCNVGAASPELSGYSFAWGETSPKADFDWDTYKWCNGNSDELTKYCNDSDYGYNGFTDNKTVLDLEDDAAAVIWGGAWRMPTKEEFGELMAYCSWLWITQNEANGYKVTGQNGNSIFLPCTSSSSGYYWSSSLYTSYPGNAYVLIFDSDDYDWSNFFRYYGRSVRAVCSPK